MLELFVETLKQNSATCCLAFLLLLLLRIFKSKESSKSSEVSKQPPGPKGYPIFGIFPKLVKKEAHLVFDDWTREYGNVYKFSIGSNTSVVLGDHQTVRTAMTTKDSAIDSRCQWRECFIKAFKGISVLPYTKKWVNTRARTMKVLKDSGMGKSFIEETMHEEVDRLIDELLCLSENGKKNFSPRNSMRRTPVNIILFVLFGDNKPSKSLYLNSMIVNVVNLLAKSSIFDILPKKLRRIFGFSLKPFLKLLDDVKDFIEEEVEVAKERVEKKDAKCFVGGWLKEEQEEERRVREGGSVAKETSILNHVLQDVIIAGAHSTGVLLNWIVCFLCLYPEQQKLLHEELMKVIGTRKAKNTDRSKLVRMEAFIQESHRMGCILPLVAHATHIDTKINGFDVPRNLEVIYNNYTINHDERVFPEPFKFKPSRWIDEQGKIKQDLTQKFFPFGIGKRSCVGKNLAKMETFLTLATMIQRIEVLKPDESTPEHLLPEIIHCPGMMAECKDFHIRVKPRD